MTTQHQSLNNKDAELQLELGPSCWERSVEKNKLNYQGIDVDIDALSQAFDQERVVI
jgi:hypothetical protein